MPAASTHLNTFTVSRIGPSRALIPRWALNIILKTNSAFSLGISFYIFILVLSEKIYPRLTGHFPGLTVPSTTSIGAASTRSDKACERRELRGLKYTSQDNPKVNDAMNGLSALLLNTYQDMQSLISKRNSRAHSPGQGIISQKSYSAVTDVDIQISENNPVHDK